MQNHISGGTVALLLAAEPFSTFYLSAFIWAAEVLFRPAYELQSLVDGRLSFWYCLM